MLEQSSVHHHHHGHGHQSFYNEEHLPDQTNKIQLTLILPNGAPSVINVDPNTPMMDLLVQAASLNKLNPSSYSLVVLDSNQHAINFKANQTVGQIVKNCHLPQLNGSSTISLLPKETTHSNPSSKIKAQPFEITARLLVNLPDAQKILLRVDPALPLHEIKEQICRQKKYAHSNRYTLHLPNKLDQPLLLGLSLAEYKTNELTLVYNQQCEYEQKSNSNQIQSFDRLYRVRSESQPPKDNIQHIEQNGQNYINAKNIDQLSLNRSSTLRPTHTTLHAYWNDPNFDTQSQLSSSSSMTKKRLAPRPPVNTSLNRQDSETTLTQRPSISNDINLHSLSSCVDHHQSQESLQSENTKRKRRAPVVAVTPLVENKNESEKVEQQQPTNHIARPGIDPPPPPPTVNPISILKTVVQEESSSPVDDEPDKQDSTIIEISHNDDLVPMNNDSELTKNDTQLPERAEVDSPNLSSKVIDRFGEQPEQVNKESSSKISRQTIFKEKRYSTIDDFQRIIKEHNERTTACQKNDNKVKETNENVSYFRVAKSRYGKFETDSKGFVSNTIAIFDSTNQQKLEQQQQQQKKKEQQQQQQQLNKGLCVAELSNNFKQSKPTPANIIQYPTKGKQAYNLLKRYEKEAQLQVKNNIDYSKTQSQQEQSIAPIQIQATQKLTHITVTDETDRKSLTKHISLMPPAPSPPPAPPMLAPKPFSKIQAEYRTVRRLADSNDEIITDAINKRSTTSDSSNRLSSVHLSASHEALMESIRKFGGLQNLRKT